MVLPRIVNPTVAGQLESRPTASRSQTSLYGNPIVMRPLGPPPTRERGAVDPISNPGTWKRVQGDINVTPTRPIGNQQQQQPREPEVLVVQAGGGAMSLPGNGATGMLAGKAPAYYFATGATGWLRAGCKLQG